MFRFSLENYPDSCLHYLVELNCRAENKGAERTAVGSAERYGD